MAPERDTPSDMSPEDALARMASVTASARGLRTRTEGLTLAIWAICLAASYLTLVVPLFFGGRPEFERGNLTGNFTAGSRPEHTRFVFAPLAPLAWYLVALVMTIGVWRGASLSFQTGFTTPYLVMVMVGWLVVFLASAVVLAFIEGGNPRAEHILAWGVVVGLFAAFNPLRFTPRGRWAAGLSAFVILAVGVFALLAHWDPRDISILSGLGLGGPLLLAGLYLMFVG